MRGASKPWACPLRSRERRRAGRRTCAGSDSGAQAAGCASNPCSRALSMIRLSKVSRLLPMCCGDPTERVQAGQPFRLQSPRSIEAQYQPGVPLLWLTSDPLTPQRATSSVTRHITEKIPKLSPSVRWAAHPRSGCRPGHRLPPRGARPFRRRKGPGGGRRPNGEDTMSDCARCEAPGGAAPRDPPRRHRGFRDAAPAEPGAPGEPCAPAGFGTPSGSGVTAGLGATAPLGAPTGLGMSAGPGTPAGLGATAAPAAPAGLGAPGAGSPDVSARFPDDSVRMTLS